MGGVFVSLQKVHYKVNLYCESIFHCWGTLRLEKSSIRYKRGLWILYIIILKPTEIYVQYPLNLCPFLTDTCRLRDVGRGVYGGV